MGEVNAQLVRSDRLVVIADKHLFHHAHAIREIQHTDGILIANVAVDVHWHVVITHIMVNLGEEREQTYLRQHCRHAKICQFLQIYLTHEYIVILLSVVIGI